MKNELKHEVVTLACARSVAAEYKIKVATAEAQLKETGEWEYLEQQREYLKTARDHVAIVEAGARKVAMNTFVKTGNKTPHPAVKIKVYLGLRYELTDALGYARDHLPQALKLNKKIFETAAKGIELDFVRVTHESRATIARDLSGYLPTGETCNPD